MYIAISHSYLLITVLHNHNHSLSWWVFCFLADCYTPLHLHTNTRKSNIQLTAHPKYEFSPKLGRRSHCFHGAWPIDGMMSGLLSASDALQSRAVFLKPKGTESTATTSSSPGAPCGWPGKKKRFCLHVTRRVLCALSFMCIRRFFKSLLMRFGSSIVIWPLSWLFKTKSTNMSGVSSVLGMRVKPKMFDDARVDIVSLVECLCITFTLYFCLDFPFAVLPL